jgi:hypothetical protein
MPSQSPAYISRCTPTQPTQGYLQCIHKMLAIKKPKTNKPAQPHNKYTETHNITTATNSNQVQPRPPLPLPPPANDATKRPKRAEETEEKASGILRQVKQKLKMQWGHKKNIKDRDKTNCWPFSKPKDQRKISKKGSCHLK